MRKRASLRAKVLKALESQGFAVNPHVRPRTDSKHWLRKVQSEARKEQIAKHSPFLDECLPLAKRYARNGQDIDPRGIDLELKEVQAGTLEEKLFRWWNLVWWSIPYQHAYGRQMRFLLWDRTHDSPFGLVYLQSPVLKMAVRDRYLDIPPEELDIWVNMSMSAQRVGALPPYNDLIGGKMVALSLTSNEVRNAYRRKYKSYSTLLKGRSLTPDLLFITTTSAFGRSSVYNRLRLGDEQVAVKLGYTRGSGSFHIPESLFEELMDFLQAEGVDVQRGFGHGPSRKLKLLSVALDRLGLGSFEYHGVQREFYMFPLANNVAEVIHRGANPRWYDRPFTSLASYWRERWALPRSEHKPEWKSFKANSFFAYRRRLISGSLTADA